MDIESNMEYNYFKETLLKNTIKVTASENVNYSYLKGLKESIVTGMVFNILSIDFDDSTQEILLLCEFKNNKKNKKVFKKFKNSYSDWLITNFKNVDIYKKELRMSYVDFLSKEDFTFEENINYVNYFKEIINGSIRTM